MAGASLQATGLIIDGCPWTCFVTSFEGLSFEPAQAERPVSDPSRDEERELVERAKRDPRQFGALYDRHFQQIYRFIYSRVREQTAAEDVTSEVFMKRSEEHTSELQSRLHLVCRLLLEKKKSSATSAARL